MPRIYVKSYRSLVHYGSHLPVLVRALALTDGPVLEMGMGINSTPVLHWLCATAHRPLVSYESSPDYAAAWQSFANEWHTVQVVTDWAQADIERPWDVAFVDHDPGDRRHVDMARLASHARYVIAHDSDGRDDAKMHYSRVLPLFKWRWVYGAYRPQTMLLSNFVDLSGFRV
jgi:hypothetical protein